MRSGSLNLRVEIPYVNIWIHTLTNPTSPTVSFFIELQRSQN
ncbi:hypothetical protein FOTG_19161 [Fusarium oxysporum f. sp. vasinfectum 25433]|uniref:Uncharacterized protein n=1 Tax=Fusarium oxysporum f. sp. vasinfectum 25433 TaxID=1089449 RepID=X0KFS6_FUSOX|nr:hypothetical protein FOTG_19161 [Fusarium oxysporum f. sp. vasinfectum 25433]